MSGPSRSAIDDTPCGALLAAAARAEARARAGRTAEATDDGETQARADVIVEQVVLAIERALRAAEPMLDVGVEGQGYDRLVAAGLLPLSGIAGPALARAREHRLADALARALEHDEEPTAPDPVDTLFADEAFALRLAEAARIDRSGDPLLPLHDTPPEARHILFWQVAACLADVALASLGEAREGGAEPLHRAASVAVSRALAAIDDGEGIAPAALRLAHALDDAGRLDDARVAAALAAGRLPLLSAMLAVRAGIGYPTAAAMCGDTAQFALLLRGCRVAPPVAAAMILTLAFGLAGPDDPAPLAETLIDGFDALPEERARAVLRRTRLEPVYADTLVAIGAAG